MISANRALEIGQMLLTIQTKKQTLNYLGEWNDLLLFLDSLKRSEDANLKLVEKK